MDKSILTNTVATSQTFLWGQFHLQEFQQIVPGVVSFNIRQHYSLQPGTLLNSITDDFMRVFCNSCAEIFGKLSEKRMWWNFL